MRVLRSQERAAAPAGGVLQGTLCCTALHCIALHCTGAQGLCPAECSWPLPTVLSDVRAAPPGAGLVVTSPMSDTLKIVVSIAAHTRPLHLFIHVKIVKKKDPNC